MYNKNIQSISFQVKLPALKGRGSPLRECFAGGERLGLKLVDGIFGVKLGLGRLAESRELNVVFFH